MPKTELGLLPALEVLEFFKNKDSSVKVFEMVYKYYLYSQKFSLDEKFMQDEKVSASVATVN